MSKQAGNNSISVTITKDERRINNWVTGKATGGVTFCAKIYDEGSVYGINKGRVSKLDVRMDGRIAVNYDRGWDLKPQAPEVKAVYKAIMAALNALDKVAVIDKPKDLLGKIEENKQKVSHSDTSEKHKKVKGDEIC